ncbi:hypothetical protein LguiA_025644 [Lonicera macranthoides]
MILEHHEKSVGHIILLVFYHIKPAEIKQQAKDLAAVATDERHIRWAAALKKVANLGGMPLKHQLESVFIEEIVDMVEGKLTPKVQNVGHHQVGMDSRVKKINLWLRDTKTDVGMLVICGMGGIGKTTTSKFVYNLNHSRFDASSFLENIRETSKNPIGLVHLQRKLLSDILNKEEKKIHEISDGHRRIQFALEHRRVLLVLDDVDELEQLDAILGLRNWFSSGSKIIITSRRGDLLKAHEKYEVHRIEKLNEDESLELFSLHAFGEKVPAASLVEHSKRFVRHCQGLPLALEVLGSVVANKKLKVWEDALKKLEVLPETKILEKLKISYDSLKNHHDQNLFLDIACFFVGKDKNDTVAILDGCDYYTELGLQNLIDRSLLSIETNNKLGMHQLLQGMGRKVVREEAKNPEEHTRLWRHMESFSILKDKIGSGKIEGLILDMNMVKKNNFATSNIHRRPSFFKYPMYLPWTDRNDEFLETDAFKEMRHLRLLKLSYVKLFGTYAVFPKELRWLYWRGLQLKSLPNEFQQENIVSIDIRNSSLERVWKVTKVLKSLKILNLSHSLQLMETPNFSNIPNLEKLVLENCPSLVEVNESLATLQRLIVLNLKDCKSLRKLPANIDDAFLNDFGSLPMLENLFLGCNPIRSLPHFIRYLAGLKMLDISWSSKLQYVSWPSTPVEKIDVTECRELKMITYETSVSPRSIEHGACMSLDYVQQGFKIEEIRNVDSKVLKNLGISNLKSIESIEVLIANGIVWSKKKCPIQILYESHIFSVCFPGRKVPHWNKSKGEEETYTPRYYGICDIDDDGSMVWLSHWFCGFWGHLFHEGDQVEVSFDINIDPRMVTDGEIKKCGIEFLYFDDEDEEGDENEVEDKDEGEDEAEDEDKVDQRSLLVENHKALCSQRTKQRANVDLESLFKEARSRMLVIELETSMCRTHVSEDQHLETLNSYLLEVTVRIENPTKGCTTLLTSLEQKGEELKARVTALEAQLEGGSSSVNQLCSFTSPGGSSKFLSSEENNAPNVILTAVNLPEPVPESFLRLLMSEEGVQDILSTIANLIENGALPTEVDLSLFPNLSYYQAASDAITMLSRTFITRPARTIFYLNFQKLILLRNLPNQRALTENVKIVVSGLVEQQ